MSFAPDWLLDSKTLLAEAGADGGVGGSTCWVCFLSSKWAADLIGTGEICTSVGSAGPKGGVTGLKDCVEIVVAEEAVEQVDWLAMLQARPRRMGWFEEEEEAPVVGILFFLRHTRTAARRELSSGLCTGHRVKRTKRHHNPGGDLGGVNWVQFSLRGAAKWYS